MPRTPHPDRPTEPLRPAPPAAVVDEPAVVSAVDPSLILLRLEDTVASLRTGLMIVGVIAVAALGVAIYGLLRDDSSTGSRSGLASDSRLTQLDGRVDRLSRQLQELRSGGATSTDTTAVAQRVDALEKTVTTLADRPATDATKAVQELSSRIDDLSSDVEQLKQNQSQTAP